MAFRTVFIGVNKHNDPAISELTGAVRDAQALSALFSDTFNDIDGVLLTDSQATLAEIRGQLDRVLVEALPDDVAVVFFAGHGTNGHQLVPFDTDIASVGNTTIPMDELAEKFRASRARAVICIIDCCFSGAAPARVLEDTPRPRAGIFDFNSFAGNGRYLLAAANAVQEAWEEPGSGHGLLTRSIIEVLTAGAGPVDFVAAVAEITRRTRENAAAIGVTQDPCFVAGVEGRLELPVLVRGDTWRRFFPDIGALQIGAAIGELAEFGIPPDVIDQWEGRYPNGLNGLQREAINTHRILNGSSLLVVAPTSSGKTFIGELAAVQAAVQGRKTVFLLPYRALVNEKYEDFETTYEPVGLRIVRCSGDFSDQVSTFLAGRYDIALLTYEMFLSLAVSSPAVLKSIGLVVIDEAQFVTDPMRGITVELLLTLIRAGRAQGINPQIIALTAVIGGINAFDEWIGAGQLVWRDRPVPLTEGVLDRSGVYQCLQPDGQEQEVQLIPRHEIQQRRREPSSQDVIVPLARSLVGAGEKLLVFRNTRGPAEGCAQYLARELGRPAAAAALNGLSPHDQSTSAVRLRACLGGGTAFHNSNLNRDERVTIERNFRNPHGGIEVLAATTTLAAGINTPASTVILAEQEFKGEDGRPFTVAEYKNMAGRAGRLGFNETGKAIILAQTPFERRALFAKYVRGQTEPIRSSFDDHDLRTWVMRLLSQVRSIGVAALPHLLASTYGGFLNARQNPGWLPHAEQQIAGIVADFLGLGLLEQRDDKVQLTLLGRACGQGSLSFDSNLRLIEVIRDLPAAELSAFNMAGLVQLLPEADNGYTPVRKRVRIENQRVTDAFARYGATIVNELRRYAADEIGFWARCKRAAVLADWLNGQSIQDIERYYSTAFGGDVGNGDILRFADSTRFYLRSAWQILTAMIVTTPEQEEAFALLMKRLEFGVPADLVPFMEGPLLLSRGEALLLAQYGVRTADQLRAYPRLEVILGRERARHISEVL